MTMARPKKSVLLTNSEMYEADRLAMAGGVAGEILMENAGRACADEICRRYAAQPTVVACGIGNNGGDGFVIARLLAHRGWSVKVLVAGEPARLSGDAATMFRRWHGETGTLTPEGLVGAGLVVDALYGAGLTRPLQDVALETVRYLNAHRLRVVSVDMPSGVDGATGQCFGETVEADLTVTFFRKKVGHVVMPGRTMCGEVVVSPIGIPETVLGEIAPATWENGPDLWREAWPVLAAEGHKYTRGHCVVVSGNLASTGAARLGARAALRAGAGLVTVASPKDALLTNAAHLTSIMVSPFGDAAALGALLSDQRKNVVLAGPGLGIGEKTREIVEVCLASGASVVLDADALTAFEGELEKLAACVKADRNREVIVTPHGGEFSRLFGSVSNKGLGKLESVRLAARNLGAVCLLKGADTIIAAPDGRATINSNAPPQLATAGSGDVLAGIISGLKAQRMPAFEAACAGVWLHGEVGIMLGRGAIAEDFTETIPEVLASLDSHPA